MKALRLIQNIKSDPRLFAKIKIFAAVGIVMVLLSGGLLVWGGLTAAKYLMNLTTSPHVVGQVQDVKSQIQNIAASVKTGCLENAQSMLNVQTWLGQSFALNLNQLITSCFDNKQQLCEGTNCKDIKDLLNTAQKGETI